MTVTVQPGDIIADKYRVVRELGRGGMGVVLAADHLQLPQQVAIKVMLTQANDVALKRFEREAHIVVQLKSEHVCRVLDAGTRPSGEPFIVMEMLEGHDLAEHIEKNGPLPLAEAAGYILEACEALAEAHTRGIVHRDLKPNNLFLTTRVDGTNMVKVLDFGISKAGKGDGGQSNTLTESGSMLGSPRFMSPEQLTTAKEIDHRTDVWALGAVLRELLTNTATFDGETPAELFVSILQEEPPPLSQTRSDLPAAFTQVIDRCLKKDIDARFANVGELARALGPFVPGSQPSVDRVVRTLEAAGWSVPVHSAVHSADAFANTAASQDAPAGLGGTVMMPQVPDASATSSAQAPAAAVQTQPSAANAPPSTEPVRAITHDDRPLPSPSQTQPKAAGNMWMGMVVGIVATVIVGAVVVSFVLPQSTRDDETHVDDDDSKKKKKKKKKKAKTKEKVTDPPEPSDPCPGGFTFCDKSLRVSEGKLVKPTAFLKDTDAAAKAVANTDAVELTYISTIVTGGVFPPGDGGSISYYYRFVGKSGPANVHVVMSTHALLAKTADDVQLKPVPAPKCPLPKALDVAYKAGFEKKKPVSILYGGLGPYWQLSQTIDGKAQSVTVSNDCTSSSTAP